MMYKRFIALSIAILETSAVSTERLLLRGNVAQNNKRRLDPCQQNGNGNNCTPEPTSAPTPEPTHVPSASPTTSASPTKQPTPQPTTCVANTRNQGCPSDAPFCYDMGEWGLQCGCEHDSDCSSHPNGSKCVNTWACDVTGENCIKKCGCEYGSSVNNGCGGYANGQASSKPYCESAYTETGTACMECFRQGNLGCDTGAGETCGEPSCIADGGFFCSTNHNSNCPK